MKAKEVFDAFEYLNPVLIQMAETKRFQRPLFKKVLRFSVAACLMLAIGIVGIGYMKENIRPVPEPTESERPPDLSENEQSTQMELYQGEGWTIEIPAAGWKLERNETNYPEAWGWVSAHNTGSYLAVDAFPISIGDQQAVAQNQNYLAVNEERTIWKLEEAGYCSFYYLYPKADGGTWRITTAWELEEIRKAGADALLEPEQLQQMAESFKLEAQVVPRLDAENILSKQYDVAFYAGEGDLFIVRRDEKNGIVNSSNEVIVPLEYQALWQFSEGRMVAMKDDLWGFLDTRGNVVIPFQYQAVSYFSEGLAAVMEGESGLVGFIDPNGNMIIEPKLEPGSTLPIFKEGFARHERRDGRYAFINKMGEPICDYVYDTEEYLYDFQNGYAVVKRDGKYGLLDQTGVETIKPEYTSISAPGEEGLCFVQKDGKIGVKKASGEDVLPLIYENYLAAETALSALSD